MRHIVADDGRLYIVEGEVDVWSLQRLGIHNVIGTYSATDFPDDIAAILDELGVKKVFYFADNDKAGDDGAAKLAALLLQSGWGGETEFRKVAGPGIPKNGDSNDLLCHHYPDLAAARAALDALPTFLPRIDEPEPASEISIPSDDNDPRWDPVKEAVRIALGATHFGNKGFSQNFSCRIPGHEADVKPSANWHRNGHYKCFYCGTFNAKDTAEFLNIPWRALLGKQSRNIFRDHTDLNAAPRDLETALFDKEAPDSLLRLSNKVYSTMYSSL